MLTEAAGRRLPVVSLVLFAISLGAFWHNHPPLFSHHEEEEAVHQPQKLAMKFSSSQRACFDSLSKSFIFRMAKEPGTESLEGILDSVSQLLADSSALFNGKLEVFLQPA